MEKQKNNAQFDIKNGLKKLSEYHLLKQQSEPLFCHLAEELCQQLDRQWLGYIDLPGCE
jgi:transcriptional accessory protein Tex/SPT6